MIGPLPPLIRWPGGQTRDAQRLARTIPAHSTYVEPFAGGLSVFFAKRPSDREVIADADPWLIDFYQQVRLGKLRRCRGGVRVHRGLFERAQRYKSACYKFALASISYDGNRVSYGPSGREGQINGAQKLRKIDDYESRLRRAHLRLGDFAKTMRKFDGPETVHFLDPPWNLDYAERMYYGGMRRQESKLPQGSSKAFDPFHVEKTARSMKGHVIVIYKDHPTVRQAFKKRPWHCYRLRSTRGASVHGARPITKLVCVKRARRK